MYDEATGLSYLNARYYGAKQGVFLSQDPSFLKIGDIGFEEKYQRKLQQHLANPQALNSYSYGLGNPITNKDPEGEIVPLLIAGWAAVEISLSLYDAYRTTATLLNPNASGGEKALSAGGFVVGLALPGGGYGVGLKNTTSILRAARGENIIGKGVDFAGKYGADLGQKMTNAESVLIIEISTLA